MAQADTTHGMIAVDKMGTQVLFLNPQTFETETVLDDFPRTVHELHSISCVAIRAHQLRACSG